jgi:hypothetical protein
MDTLRDYIVVVPSVVAVIVTLILVVVAQFFKDRMAPKITLVVVACILSAGGIAATVYGQHQIVADRQAAAQRNEDIRNTLGDFMAQGLAIISPGCADPDNTTPPVEAVNAWRDRVVAYLGNQLGRSYVQRLNNIPPGFTTNVHCNNGHYSGVVRAVVELNTHLEQFSQQSSF